MFIRKDQITGAKTKTDFKTRQVIDWDATLTMWFLVGLVFFGGHYLIFS